MNAFSAIYGTLLAAATRAEPGSNRDTPAMTDIHDIKPVLEIGDPWPWLLYLACGAILLLLGLAWWVWARRSKPSEPIDPDLPELAPDEEALTALDALATETGLPPKQFFFRLSAILRRYVERRYSFPAAEMTTEELLPHIDRLSLDHSLASGFRGFCQEADPIKFAGAMTNPERAQQQLAFCRDFVFQTRQNIQEGDDSDASHAP